MTRAFDLAAERERLALTPDCARCFGLCCVAHSFKATESFAYDKPPGVPCRNLLADFTCTIHHRLRPEGFSGCTAYTCYGAGQKISQQIFGGRDWRQAPETAELMFQTLPIVRQLNQLLWFITEALDHRAPGAVHRELLDLLVETERLAETDVAEMSWADVDRHCLRGERLLGQVSAAIRAAAVPAETERNGVWSRADDPPTLLRPGSDCRGADLRRAELHGVDVRRADLRGADLRGVDLCGAVLSGADLSDADLRWADLMGADLTGTSLAGADLSSAIFVTQSQLELAQGNTGTKLSDPLRTPVHWPGTHETP